MLKYNNVEPDLWSLYLYALKSPVTRENYQKRLERFFDFLGLEGSTVEEKSKVFMETTRKHGNQGVFNSLRCRQVKLNGNLNNGFSLQEKLRGLR